MISLFFRIIRRKDHLSIDLVDSSCQTDNGIWQFTGFQNEIYLLSVTTLAGFICVLMHKNIRCDKILNDFYAIELGLIWVIIDFEMITITEK